MISNSNATIQTVDRVAKLQDHAAKLKREIDKLHALRAHLKVPTYAEWLAKENRRRGW